MNIAPATDFDFAFGSWVVRHRRLRHRLTGSTDWEEFTGTSCTRPVLGGFGNIEDNVLDLPDGRYKAVALRSFDSATRTWAIWWLDHRQPHQLDVPVIGSFADDVGAFYARSTLDGRAILVRFFWLTAQKTRPRWEQAFSSDDGTSWETNWTMGFEPA